MDNSGNQLSQPWRKKTMENEIYPWKWGQNWDFFSIENENIKNWDPVSCAVFVEQSGRTNWRLEHGKLVINEN
jgi:hypothetical protein